MTLTCSSALASLAQIRGWELVVALGSDKLKLYAAERLIELMVECAGTINTEVGQALAGAPPSDYTSSFFGLVSAQWISQDLAVQLAEWARMRNTLVHRYDTLAADEFTTLLSLCVQPWRVYLSAILTHLP